MLRRLVVVVTSPILTNMLTLKQVNKALAPLGEERLYKGEGYYYFADGNAHMWEQCSVYVYTLNQLTLEQWLEEYTRLSKDS